MSKLTTPIRIFLGLIFVVFGLNGFLNFIPMGPLPDGAMGFMGGLASASYFFPVLKITEIIAGLMLLSGKFVPLSLIILAPIVLQINLFHVFLAPDPMGTGMGVILGIAGIILAMQYKSSFASTLNPNAQPG